MIISSSPTKKSSCTTIQKIAQTRQEREAAFGLIYQSYLHASQPTGWIIYRAYQQGRFIGR